MYEAHHASLVEVFDCPNTNPDKDTTLLLAACQPFTGPFASGAPEEGGAPGAPPSAGAPDASDRQGETQDSKTSSTLTTTDRLAALLDAIDSMIDVRV